jgi:ribonuclease BN (tRNA processing enzyme)
VRETLEGLMRPPYFPVPLSGAPAELRFVRAGGESLQFGDVTAECTPLNHPDGSLAWRLTRGRRRVVFATDHEHGDAETDKALLRFSEGADLVIYDATYIPAEYESLRRGWGHSTWYAAVALARSAGVKTLALFHHHPDHSDDELERLLAFAQADFPGTVLAYEGMEFSF